MYIYILYYIYCFVLHVLHMYTYPAVAIATSGALLRWFVLKDRTQYRRVGTYAVPYGRYLCSTIGTGPGPTGPGPTGPGPGSWVPPGAREQGWAQE